LKLKNRLQFFINSTEISKSALAREIGVTRQTITRITKGHSPSMEIGLKIAKYFGKDVGEIFFDTVVQHIAHGDDTKIAQ
jgi:putative transcriptional regulator